jgi:hypothetical protein
MAAVAVEAATLVAAAALAHVPAAAVVAVGRFWMSLCRRQLPRF